ncbi:M20/M25/M40 family metallo-hydrolase [Nitratifractor sp.]
MIGRVFELFEEITALPHCSGETEALREFIVAHSRRCSYDVEVDSVGNILASRGEPGLCLQAHYDMVCVGRALEIEIVEEAGWLRAVDSSLGADNGIAVAMMLALMEEGKELEMLFTAEEEVGLVGAKALAFDLQSSRLLNLDTEEEGTVYVGCAGGVDLIAERECSGVTAEGSRWELELSGLPGGHSGVDIDKEIPNAIKILAQRLLEEELPLESFVGGERRNSIPTRAVAVVRSEAKPKGSEGVRVRSLPQEERPLLSESEKLLTLLATAPHGVVAMDEELGIPYSSLNLAKVSLRPGECRVEYSLRAMSDEGLDGLEASVETLLKRHGFACRMEDRYPAWKPEIDDFVREVAAVEEEVFGACETKAIHAGLECGILSQKYPGIRMASIGPTIENPHSIRERVKIESMKKTWEVLRKIVDRFA